MLLALTQFFSAAVKALLQFWTMLVKNWKITLPIIIVIIACFYHLHEVNDLRNQIVAAQKAQKTAEDNLATAESELAQEKSRVSDISSELQKMAQEDSAKQAEFNDSLTQANKTYQDTLTKIKSDYKSNVSTIPKDCSGAVSFIRGQNYSWPTPKLSTTVSQ